ncbi:hypothetical protein P691DRAFT_787861 [Macrolepiota fuliginosa MF-IS2]|uniref:NACHT domain-containing protein n=1 Tax=Macrolepiota fuliginosa MF-IS2 TaxID=1400762 RepID=A0A9P6BZI4_9AGAR|nr:hypothetical protein P691DRAFT_787861 [Macrolepiota fuliginosa MF-IS2]
MYWPLNSFHHLVSLCLIALVFVPQAPSEYERKQKEENRGYWEPHYAVGSSGSAANNQTPHAGSFGSAHNFTISSLTMIEGDITNEGQFIKLLSKHIIIGAEFDSSNHGPSCHPETRLNISRSIQAWMRNLTREYKILWLSGPAGVGKSAILQTIAEAEAASSTSILGATLFFSRPNERDDPQCVFTTIAYQLSMKYLAYRKYIVELLAFNPVMVKKSMKEQFKAFIGDKAAENTWGILAYLTDKENSAFLGLPELVTQFQQELLAGTHDTILILLDGLDECKGDDAQREIILLIAKFALQYPTSPLIWLIASRPESHIQDTFSLDAVRLSYGGMEVDVDSDEGRHDVEKYLRDNFADIRKKHWRSIPSSLQQWPSESDFTTIATRSSGLFIFPSTLIRFVGDEDYADPSSRLKMVLDIIESTTVSPGGKNPFAALDALYTHILSEIPLDILQTTLSLMVFYTQFGKWPFAHSCSLLRVPQGRAYGALRRLHSVLKIPEPGNAFEEPLEAFHASFYDYLSSLSRSGTFYIRTLEIIQHIVHRWIDILLESHSVAKWTLRAPAEMADIDATRINLSWPHENEECWLGLQRNIFGWVLGDLINILDKFVNDSVRNEFSRLSAFFQDLDFGEGLRTYSGLFMSAYPISPFSADLENWGVLKIIPLQSFNYNDIRPDLPPAIDQWREERDDVSLRVVWLGDSGLAQLKTTLSFHIMDSQGKSRFGGVPHFDLSKDPNRNVDLEKNLASWTIVAPSHPIIMLGKGRKSCAVIHFYVPSEGLWALALPCVQSS